MTDRPRGDGGGDRSGGRHDGVAHRLLTPRRRASCFGSPAPPQPDEVHVRPTPIVDGGQWTLELVAATHVARAAGDRSALQALHRHIAATVRATYAFDETQRASVTWRRGRGSCSQRLAVLEAAARSIGVPTCVRGRWIDGRFWYPRFRALSAVIPDRVLVPWPSFHVSGQWVEASELFASVENLAQDNPVAFGNDGETLFDALRTTAIDWDGRTAGGACAMCDLSSNVLADLGYFDSRDALLAANGQTLCRPARAIGNALFSRRVV